MLSKINSARNECLNRTFMELKLVQGIAYGGGRGSLNRTFMELKHASMNLSQVSKVSS